MNATKKHPAREPRGAGIKIVYDPRMNAPAQGFSPSAAKPAAVMAAWLATWPQIQLRSPEPVDLDTLCLAHDEDYVRGIFALREANGFRTRSEAVNASLPWTTGAMLTAARWALSERAVACAPVSGFHHAHWDEAAGFCTFNGLMVTALALQHDCPGLRVGILDYDFHYGDGTDDIIDTLEPAGIVHRSAGKRWKHPDQATDFLAAIRNDLHAMKHCDIVLYQAGADPHIDDPLGGFLDTDQLKLRDWRVFDGLRRRGIPVAWNLAGGYQQPLARVVELHSNTVRALIAAGENPPTPSKAAR